MNQKKAEVMMMNKKQMINIIISGCIAFIVIGCSSLLPSSKKDIQSEWKSFDEAKKAFDQIVPYSTTHEDLKRLGYDPFKVPNIELLTYLQVIQKFMPNNSISKEDLDEGVQDCIAAKDDCSAYEIKLSLIREERFGNVFLDLFSFRRKTKVYGWKFNAFIVLKGDLVVYKIWGGKPNIDELIDNKKPLGPLQDMGGDLLRQAAKL